MFMVLFTCIRYQFQSNYYYGYYTAIGCKWLFNGYSAKLTFLNVIESVIHFFPVFLKLLSKLHVMPWNVRLLIEQLRFRRAVPLYVLCTTTYIKIKVDPSSYVCIARFFTNVSRGTVVDGRILPSVRIRSWIWRENTGEIPWKEY